MTTIPINLTINGQTHSLDIDTDMPLLWALRDLLGLTGTKFGCGMGLCGACTVHVDGLAVRSCITTAASVANSRITTIEGLSIDGSHPLQQAWILENVAQCGYCQAGQIMNAAALLNNNPHPSDDEIDAGTSGVLCRCGTYLRIRRAIHRAAEGVTS
jgi:isoquinoline 1-oxidoreductase subunit alpha